MSLAAVAWLLDDCPTRGDDGWVLLALAHHANEDGYAWLSKRTIARETRMSEPKVWRHVERLIGLGQLRRAEPGEAPAEWLAIRPDRKPTLFHLTGFTASRFGPVDNVGDGVTTGSRIGAGGVTTGSHVTPSDLPRENANLEQEMNLEGAGHSAAVDNPPDPDHRPCRGTGRLWNATGGFWARCKCVWDPEHVPTSARPTCATRPPVGVGRVPERGRR